MNEWKTSTIEDLYTKLEAGFGGLSSDEAVKRLKSYGGNSLPEKKPEGVFLIGIRQLLSPFVVVLAIASLILFFLGERVDASVILVVIVVNAIIGIIQEGKAQNTLYALKKFTKTKALVLRDGIEVRINSTHIVPGDILILRAGDKVPADSRLVEASNIRVNESSLTGESESVGKGVFVAENDEDSRGVVLNGTYVSAGSGKAVVVTTGEKTVIGSISKKLEKLDTDVPLKKNIRQLSRIILIGTILASILLFIFGTVIGYPFEEMFFLAVAIAVSVIPEGLPVVITLILALGVHRMGKQNALVKRMQAVEALGQADVVAVDKTGTITRNELMVTEVYADGTTHVISGQGYEKTGSVSIQGNLVNPTDHPALILAVRSGVLTSDASVYKKEDGEAWEIIGDPTEASIIVLGHKIGIEKKSLSNEIELLQEVPFQSDLRYHASLYKEKNNKVLYVAGAPEKLIDVSTRVYKGGRSIVLNQLEREKFLEQFQEMSGRGQRVLAVVTKKIKDSSFTKDSVKGMTLVGLLGMQDSIREGTRESVAVAKRSGIEIVMITGDFRGTAVSIAEQAGIFSQGDKVLTGDEIAKLSEEELAEQLDGVTVFARVTAEQKFMIVNAYKKLGKKIAMTGDGVNDALSLVSADLGIGMGLTGTEVAKEASDIVLLDDNIKSILAAIDEGRGIYITIRKVILYMFSTNLSELFVIVLALTFLLPLPLQPSQILWLNLITDGFLVLAFAFDPKQSDELASKTKGSFIISKQMFARMALMSAVMTIGTLIIFYLFYGGEQSNLVKGWTAAMTAMAFFQWFNVWNVRSRTKSIISKGTFSNPYLIGAAILVVILQLFAIYTPAMNTFLKTTPLAITELAFIIAITTSVVLVEEVRKLFLRINVK